MCLPKVWGDLLSEMRLLGYTQMIAAIDCVGAWRVGTKFENFRRNKKYKIVDGNACERTRRWYLFERWRVYILEYRNINGYMCASMGVMGRSLSLFLNVLCNLLCTFELKMVSA